ncbi:phytanoyl-CoA dioxygenase family protein [Novosphingobium sp. PS1R-30]|uniref:Phytanoyl-CoA dioxygenase family protein n=1 Tax=Novosphingobium anseongense TaxID=3133436 RepID=A0ABU8RZS7_9SPHN
MSHDLDNVPALVAQLRRDGYLILNEIACPATIDAIGEELTPHFDAVPYCQGPFYGAETKRLGRVLARSRSAHGLVLHDLVYDIVNSVLQPNCHSLQLNLTQAIEIFPGAPAQGPHRDHDMWWTPKGETEYMINVMWALDDFTERNGATRVWPGSNHKDQSEPLLPDEDAISAVMPKGSACIFLGSTMHSGGENHALRSRRGLIVSYCLGWLKPWENQWLAYPPEVARTFAPEVAALVGYRQHLPSLNNFEGQCPSLLLGNDSIEPFVDALLPEQAALAEQYREMRLGQFAEA